MLVTASGHWRTRGTRNSGAREDAILVNQLSEHAATEKDASRMVREGYGGRKTTFRDMVVVNYKLQQKMTTNWRGVLCAFSLLDKRNRRGVVVECSSSNLGDASSGSSFGQTFCRILYFSFILPWS